MKEIRLSRQEMKSIKQHLDNYIHTIHAHLNLVTETHETYDEDYRLYEDAMSVYDLLNGKSISLSADEYNFMAHCVNKGKQYFYNKNGMRRNQNTKKVDLFPVHTDVVLRIF